MAVNVQDVMCLIGEYVRMNTELERVPGCVADLLEGDLWRTAIREEDYDSLAGTLTQTPWGPDALWCEFRAAKSRGGLGGGYGGLGIEDKQLLLNLCRDHPVLPKLRNAERMPSGPSSTNNGSKTRATVQGNTRAYTLDRLERERPDLLEQVHAGQLSANAAAVVAGFRKPTFTVVAGDPEAAARAIRKRYSGKDLKRLRDLL